MKKNKKQRRVLMLLILLLSVTIGFALLSVTLKINGTAGIKGNTWDIHWDDTSINVTEESIAANDPVVSTTTSTKDTVSFNVELELPGDFYEFEIDAVNEGTVDGELDLAENWITYKSNDETTTLPSYLEFSVKYDDDTTPTSGDILEKRIDASTPRRQTYKVRVAFKSSVEELPENPQPITIEVELPYIQHKKTGIKYDLGDLVYFDPVSDNPCNSTTFDLDAVKSNNSTCYKWRVITKDDTVDKTDIKLQMDHNIINSSAWSSTGFTKDGPVNILNAFSGMMSNWTRVPLLTYSYDASQTTTDPMNDYGGFDSIDCNNGACTITRRGSTTTLTSSGVRARLITAEELLEIAQTEFPTATWTQQSQYGENITITTNDNKNLAWLLENTLGGSTGEASGATANVYGNNTNNGYWTLTPSGFNYNYTWLVHVIGSVDCYFGVHDTSNIGARPVITIEKDKITKE